MSYITETAQKAHQAATAFLGTDGNTRDEALKSIARDLMENKKFIFQANQKDLEAAKKAELKSSLVDRLTINEKRIGEIVSAINDIRGLPDPVGEIAWSTVRPNGLTIHQERVPIGVVGIIFESRPNIIPEIAALCLKSGNACILRGGKESINTNVILGEIIANGLKAAGLNTALVQVIDKTERELVTELLKQKDCIDIIVPRGGEGLISFVTENSLIPVIKHDKGNCHTFIDAGCDEDLAVKIAVNAKTQRPGVCNAMETLLIHKDFPAKEKVLEALKKAGVSLKGCADICALDSKIEAASEDDWHTEYLDLILAVKQVDSLRAAIDWINKYGSGHSEAILTTDLDNARTFQDKVDAACVFVNSSTRFADGNRFGLGAEVGISTQKLHVRGPMGLRDLTCLKYKVTGTGHIVE